MKNQLHRIATLIGLSALLGSALVAASSTAEVPFDFQVQDRAMPAGTYTVTKANDHGVINMINLETGESIFVSAPANKYGDAGVGKLVFRKYGSRYFLGQIWFAGQQIGQGTIAGASEKELIGIPAKTAPVLASIRLK